MQSYLVWCLINSVLSRHLKGLEVLEKIKDMRLRLSEYPSRFLISALVLFCQTASSQTATTTCDLNNDGLVNVVDVQLITNMEIGASGFSSCTSNIAGVLGCTDSARLVVIKAVLGQGCHFISLNWTASSSAGVTGYNIYRGTSPGAESSTPLNTGGPVASTSFTDTTAVSGTKYYYVIKSSNGSSESGPSTEVSATAL